MERSLLGMLAVFVLTFVTGVAGLLVLPGAWIPVFASVAGVSGIGLSVTGYAIRKQ
ncbi:hypothetical protein [Haloarcula rara]|uniref:hypothetical protein n=1 Tax=Haloarcula rara TaxID=3033387 RepID=UPI0023E765F1|nr:hypothetical protein [Halomicroarcula sp. SHR3]